MIKFNLTPGLILMTGFALRAVAAMMYVVIGMAAVAAGRGVFLHRAPGMTGTAGNLGMFVGQRKTRRTVIEHSFVPAVDTVAGVALQAIFTRMHIRRLVAVHAGHVPEFINLPGVAAAAGNFLMQPLQGKAGC